MVSTSASEQVGDQSTSLGHPLAVPNLRLESWRLGSCLCDDASCAIRAIEVYRVLRLARVNRLAASNAV